MIKVKVVQHVDLVGIVSTKKKESNVVLPVSIVGTELCTIDP